jgi:sucrose-6-phosphate hydrolase SacC (GH32 family)
MSLPRVLLPRPDGTLGVQPAPELRSLRRRHLRLENVSVSPSAPTAVELLGAALEVVAEFRPGQAAQFGLKVRCAPDGSEQTLVTYDPRSGWLSIDRAHSSLDPAIDREPHGTYLKLAADEHLLLHIFVDHSVVEVYANDRACVTSRVYPSRADSLGVEVFARGGPAQLHQFDVWEMGSIWDGTANR